jgi:cytochrome b6-f complex iron-sulfur subunit
MSSPTPQPDSSRRRFLARQLKWLLAGTLAALATPLLRFAGFTVKPKPRYVTVNKKLPPGSVLTEHDFILFVADTGARAVSRRCTHLGCRANFRKELGIIECPCHQSQFSPEGTRLAGPAQKNLATFPVRVLKDDQGAITGYEVTL